MIENWNTFLFLSKIYSAWEGLIHLQLETSTVATDALVPSRDVGAATPGGTPKLSLEAERPNSDLKSL